MLKGLFLYNPLFLYRHSSYIQLKGEYSFNVYALIDEVKHKNVPLYISEGYAMRGAHSAYLLSTGRRKAI